MSNYVCRMLALLLYISVGVATDFSFALGKETLKLPPKVKLVANGANIEGTPSGYKFLFPNGLRLLVLQDTRNPMAVLKTIFDAGSNREVKGQTGMAHFFEHMMFRKTRSNPEGYYSSYLASVGGSGNAGTSTDYVTYYSNFPAPALETMLQLEFERFTNLEFDEPFFSIEKGAVISERGISLENSPINRGKEVLNSLIDKGTSYEWPIIGLKKDVLDMKKEDVKAFYRKYYVPNNAAMIVGSPYGVQQTLDMVYKIFVKWEAGADIGKIDFPRDYIEKHAGNEFICSEEVTDQQYQIVYPSFANTYEDIMMSDALIQLLDDNLEGTVDRRFIKAQLAVAAQPYKDRWIRSQQPFKVHLVLSKDQKFKSAYELWQKVIAEISHKKVDAAFKKDLLKTMEVANAERALRMSSLASDFLEYEYWYHDFLIAKKDKAMIMGLTENKLRAWVSKNLNLKNAYVTGVVPKGMAKPCSEYGKGE